jgi:putative ABC transport system permease protein
VSVGDSVTIGEEGNLGPFTVVGIVVLPGLPTNAADIAALGGGALLTMNGAAAVAGIDDPHPIGPTVIVDLQPGASPQDFLARVNAAATAEGYGENVRVSGPGLPSVPGSPVESVEVAAYRQVVSTPIALAAILAVLAAATVSFALVTSVRRRRRDFGTLQALGFSRAQVRATVAWHAATVALVATVIGVPLGVIAGRIAWLAAARQIGVPESAAVPWTFVVLAPVVALVAANVVAALPARSAAMTAPAEALRDE